MRPACFGVFSFGVVICAVNFYLSYVRYSLNRVFSKKTEYHFVSGFPILGSFLVVVCLAMSRFPRWALIVGIIAAVLDTGGIHWFIGIVGWHKIIWNYKPARND